MSAIPRLPASMRAWRVHEFGPEPREAMRLESVPLPVPGPGELLVGVQAIPLRRRVGPALRLSIHRVDADSVAAPL